MPDEELAVLYPVVVTSEIREEDAPYAAFLPQHVPEEGLPMLILLHGAGGSWRDWSLSSQRELQRLSTEHQLIIVTPEGREYGWYLDSDRELTNQMSSWFFDELLPDLRSRLPTTGVVGIGGLSMGGHGALTFALTHPGSFASVSTMSAVTDLPFAASRTQLQELLGVYGENVQAWESRSAIHLLDQHAENLRGIPLRMVCGTEDIWITPNQAFHMRLTALGLEHIYVESKASHSWTFWRSQLAEDVAWHASVLHPSGADEE